MAWRKINDSILSDIANAVREKAGTEDFLRPQEIAEEVTKLPFVGIPSYHYEEAGRVIKTIRDLKEAHPNSIVFGTMSDNHPTATIADSLRSTRHAAFALETVGRFAGCDFVANLGDNLSSTTLDTENTYADFKFTENATMCFLTSQTAFSVVGNHEKSASTQKIYDSIGKYNVFDAYPTTRIRGFGYRDFAEKKG